MSFFSGEGIWTDDELLAFVKAGELAMIKGVSNLTFQGQQIGYRSMKELKEAVKMVRDELINRGVLDESTAVNKVKQIQVTTRDSGFGNG